jgi:23S rRNA pseudouridine1911/1915/1917 synthase
MSDQGVRVETRSWTVPDGAAAVRLDAFVRRCLPHLSRRQVESAIQSKLFRINERIGKKGDKLSAGDVLTFSGQEHWFITAPAPQPKLQVSIVYEDASVLVVDKPAGMPTHGFSGRDDRTLANFLAAQRPDLLTVGKSRWEPGLVHRLDRDTSGLVLVAKTQSAFEQLVRQFRRREINKKYLALVWRSAPAEGSIAYPIGHDPRDARRMRALLDAVGNKARHKSREALTRFRKLREAGGLSLLEIDMETGVTHQIRVHLAAIGHPIVGDLLYGGERLESFGLKRHFLHASCLEFFHPENCRRTKADSKLPADLADVLTALRMTV